MYLSLITYQKLGPNFQYIKTHQAFYQVHFVGYTFSGVFSYASIWIVLFDWRIAPILSSHSLLSWGLFLSFLCVCWILCCFLFWVIPFRDFVIHKNVFSLCLLSTDGLAGNRILVGNNFLLLMMLLSSFVPSVFHSNYTSQSSWSKTLGNLKLFDFHSSGFYGYCLIQMLWCLISWTCYLFFLPCLLDFPNLFS